MMSNEKYIKKLEKENEKLEKQNEKLMEKLFKFQDSFLEMNNLKNKYQKDALDIAMKLVDCQKSRVKF